ncbi:MAG: DUF4956 domain-containing protein [Clostridia bacterium]|nr:DUF4956 domain-containing protein [Clostridia bacterium]MBR5424524.1 DUF4956 domain-containing protein [Clostridia bacterium]
MFDSIYSASVTVTEYFTMAAAALLSGVVFAWLMSFKVRSTKRFFIVNAILPFAIATVITFVSGNIGAGVAFGGAFALIRFRSAQGTADELASILMAMCSGVAFGMGYIAYGVIVLLCLSGLYFLLSMLPIFEHKTFAQEKLLKVTIPESLDYTDVFDDTFRHYLKSFESVGVKTTGMGSMFRLSFRIKMKDPAEEKAFIDELRTKNGNLEIAILPYVDPQNQL